jgi:hypothetical protein
MGRIAWTSFLAALVGSLILASPAAAKDKPDAALKTTTIDASVSIDPALKAYRGLYSRLLASGKRQMETSRADADQDYRENPKLFSGGRRCEFERTVRQESAIRGYVSVVGVDYSFTAGAAHPNRMIETFLWDSKARRFIKVRRFFKETKIDGPAMRTLAAAVRAAVLAEKKARGIPQEVANDPMWMKDVQPDLTKVGGVTLAPSTERGKSAGLLAYFSPYAVGPYAEGSYVVFVPWSVFKAHLSPAGVRLFGGTRPPRDAGHEKP